MDTVTQVGLNFKVPKAINVSTWSGMHRLTAQSRYVVSPAQTFLLAIAQSWDTCRTTCVSPVEIIGAIVYSDTCHPRKRDFQKLKTSVHDQSALFLPSWSSKLAFFRAPFFWIRSTAQFCCLKKSSPQKGDSENAIMSVHGQSSNNRQA